MTRRPDAERPHDTQRPPDCPASCFLLGARLAMVNRCSSGIRHPFDCPAHSRLLETLLALDALPATRRPNRFSVSSMPYGTLLELETSVTS